MRIGDGSWLGYGTVVLPGPTIGRHVVIGANSVVRGDIPDYCVAAGSPAKVIRDRAELAQQLRSCGRARSRASRLSAAKTVELLADRDAVDGGLGERRRCRRPAGRRRSRGGPRCRCGSRLPQRARWPAPLAIGGLHRDDVVEHPLDDVGGLVDDVAPLGEHRRVVLVDAAEIGELHRARPRPPRRSPGPASAHAAIADLVDRLLGREEQRPDPERGEQHDDDDDRRSATGCAAPARRRSAPGWRCRRRHVARPWRRPIADGELQGGAADAEHAGDARRRSSRPSAVQSRSMAWSRLNSPGPIVATAQATTAIDAQYSQPWSFEDEEADLAVARQLATNITPIIPAAASGVSSPTANSSPAPISVAAASAGLDVRPAHARSTRTTVPCPASRPPPNTLL